MVDRDWAKTTKEPAITCANCPCDGFAGGIYRLSADSDFFNEFYAKR